MTRNKIVLYIVVSISVITLLNIFVMNTHKYYSINSFNPLSLAFSTSMAEYKYNVYNKVKSENLVISSGNREGKWTLFYDANRIVTDDLAKVYYYRIFNFKNDIIIGKWHEFTITEIPTFYGSSKLINGKVFFDGECIWYDDDGKIIAIKNYKNGSKNGKYLELFSGGKFKIVTSYLHNQRNGVYKEYYENGQIKVKGNYLNGNETGFWYYFEKSGDYKKYKYNRQRVGAICRDGTRSYSTGRGTCSWHGGVAYWLYDNVKEFIEEKEF